MNVLLGFCKQRGLWDNKAFQWDTFRLYIYIYVFLLNFCRIFLLLLLLLLLLDFLLVDLLSMFPFSSLKIISSK